MERWTRRLHPLYVASAAKWWFDDINHAVFYRFGGVVARAAFWFDANIIDGTVNDVGELVRSSGRGLSRLQSGRVQNYALGIALGLLGMAAAFFVVAAR